MENNIEAWHTRADPGVVLPPVVYSVVVLCGDSKEVMVVCLHGELLSKYTMAELN